MMRFIRRAIMWASRSPAAVPDAARVDVSVDDTSCAVRFRYGAGDAGSAPLERSEALGQSEALLEKVLRRLMKRSSPVGGQILRQGPTIDFSAIDIGQPVPIDDRIPAIPAKSKQCPYFHPVKFIGRIRAHHIM